MPIEEQMKIQRYKELDKEQIEMIAAVRKMGDNLQEVFDNLQQLPNVDKRWVSIAKTHMQQGLMALNRAIIKPDFF